MKKLLLRLPISQEILEGKIKYLVWLCLLFLCSSLIAGCQKTEEADETIAEKISVDSDDSKKDELVFAVNADSVISVVNFQNVWMNRSQFWGGLVFQGLLMADGNISNVKPDLCEEYIISPDGKSYVFLLKDNVYWHDGRKLTVEDVVWSIETCMRSLQVNGYVQKGLMNIEGMEEFLAGTPLKNAVLVLPS